MHGLQIWGAANDLPRQPAWLFQQHIDRAANKAGIKAALVASDDSLQPLQPIGFHFLRDLIVHFGGRRSRSCRIYERKRAGKTNFIYESKRLTEIRLGLAWKTHDEIGSESEVCPACPQACNHVEIIPARMFSIHRRQN